MGSWFLFAFIAMVGWGLWGFFSKLASMSLPSHAQVLWATVGTVLALPFIFLVAGVPPLPDKRGLVYALLVGMLATFCYVSFVLALQRGKVALVMTVTALYPLVTILLAFLVLHETITLKQGVGIGLGLLAITLLSS